MPKPAESLLKYYEKSDEQTRELIIEKGKELAHEWSEGRLGHINARHDGHEWVSKIHDFLLFGFNEPDGSIRPLNEPYINFKQKLGRTVSNAKSSRRWETISGNISVADRQKLERFMKKEGFSSIGSYISWTLTFREDKKSIEDKFNSLVAKRVEKAKLSYTRPFLGEVQVVKKMVKKLATYTELFGAVPPEAIESNADGIAKRERKLRSDLPVMLGRSKGAKVTVDFDDLLNLNPVTGLVDKPEEDEVLNFQISRSELESLKTAIDMVGDEFESLARKISGDEEA